MTDDTAPTPQTGAERPEKARQVAVAELVAQALAGHRMTDAEARELAVTLRAANAAFGPSRSSTARRMTEAADLLAARAGHRRRPR